MTKRSLFSAWPATALRAIHGEVRRNSLRDKIRITPYQSPPSSGRRPDPPFSWLGRPLPSGPIHPSRPPSLSYGTWTALLLALLLAVGFLGDEPQRSPGPLIEAPHRPSFPTSSSRGTGLWEARRARASARRAPSTAATSGHPALLKTIHAERLNAAA